MGFVLWLSRRKEYRYSVPYQYSCRDLIVRLQGEELRIFYGDNAHEFEYMVEGGMSPLEAIRAATVEAATLLGMQDQLGTIEAGAFSDIVAVPQDPAQDITTMERVSFVMKNGVIYKQPN